MLEVVVFAITLVVAQLVAGVGILTLFLSDWFMKKCMKKSMDMAKETIEMMEKENFY